MKKDGYDYNRTETAGFTFYYVKPGSAKKFKTLSFIIKAEPRFNP